MHSLRKPFGPQKIDVAAFEQVTSAILVALLISAVVATASGCKPAANDGAELKTLDALAGTEVGTNDCNGANPGLSGLDADLKARAAQQIIYPAVSAAAVERAFTAVPAGLTRAILLLGYEIKYSENPADECQGVDAGALRAVTGCTKVSAVNAADGSQGEKVTLILDASPKAVAHSTLLGVLSLVSKKLGRIQAENGVLVLKDDEDVAMSGFRRDFAVAVFDDAYRAGKTLALAGLLPSDPSFTARTTSSDARRALWDAFAAAEPAKAEAAELSIFANGGDSFYCNATTKAALAAWPTARDLWASEMASDIDALQTLGRDGKVEAAPVAEDGSEAGGMMLWGFRRPLGGFFANRVANTGYAFPRMHGLRRGWDGSGWHQPPAWGEGRLGWRLRGDYYE